MKRTAVALLVLAYALAYAVSTYAEEPPTLTQEYFGINLGMDLKTLAAKCRQAGVSADTQKWSYPGRIIGLNGALNGNQAIKETKGFSYNDRVYMIELVFKDGSPQNYYALKGALEKKYGKDEAVLGAVEMESRFSTTVDGQAVSITLDRDVWFTESGEVLSVSYNYDALWKLVVEERNRRKVSKVVDDL